MSELSCEDQHSLQLEIGLNSEKLQDSKLERAKKLVPDLTETPIGFEKCIREVIYLGNYQPDTLDERVARLNGNFSKQEILKIQICYLLDRNNSMTMAHLYEYLGSSIKGEASISQGYNRIIWDDINEEGIAALIELEEERWIEFEVISPEEFLNDDISLKESLANLPVAQSVKAWNKDYKNPRWLPVKYSAGLMLIATKLFCNSLSSDTSPENQLIHQINFLEIDRFANPEEIDDERQRVLQSIIQRQGQPQFRVSLLEVYNGRCAITDCNVQEALEAAHVVPYLGLETNHLSNGLILRADLHTLFDLFLFTINPESLTVIVSPNLKSTPYSKFDGKVIRQRKKGYSDISKGALHYHLNQCQWLKN